MTERIGVALSGGADSALAAALLSSRGYSIFALHLLLAHNSKAYEQASRAKDVARRLGIRIFQFASYLMIRQRITDHTSGFRAYNRRAFSFLADHYPTDYPEPEVVILMGRNRFVMKETFTQMLRRQGGVSSIPIVRGPYYMIKVLLAMFMASIRSRIINEPENK